MIRLSFALLLLAAAPAFAGHCFLDPPSLFSQPSPDGTCPAGAIYYDGEMCTDDDGLTPLMLFDNGAYRCLNASELAARQAAACSSEYEAEAVAAVESAWPPLAEKQVNAGNAPSARVACYDDDLVAIDASLSAAIAALNGLSAEQMEPCPSASWPAMRYYTQQQIDDGEVTTCD